MNETNPERILEQLAFGNDWKLDNISKLISAVDSVQQKLQNLTEALPSQWQGDAADLALARYRVHNTNLGKYRDALFKIQSLVTGMGESFCAATCANTTRATEAQRLLSSLPSGIVPSWVHDKVNQGASVEVAGFGKVDLNSGTEWLSNAFSKERSDAAERAVKEMQGIIVAESSLLKVEVAYDPLPVNLATGETEEVPPFVTSGTGPEGRSGPDIGPTYPGFPGVAGGPNVPGGSGGPDGPGGGNGGGNDGNGGGNGGDGNGGGNGGGSGGNGGGPGGNGGGSGPSVDSNLDGGGGGGLRPGLGAAGLGAVGLAAGAKIASGSGSGLSGLGGVFGGAGGAGGLGAGGGGLRGVAVAAGGGAGSGAASSGAAAGAGGRPSGMMGGGGAGGSNQKKGKRVGLGYIAPTLEDEGDGGPAANASRGGSRGWS